MCYFFVTSATGLEDALEEPVASSQSSSLSSHTADSPDMASSPGLDGHPLPLFQLDEVDSSKVSERSSSPGPLPSIYSPPLSMDSHTVCIPSLYTDSSHEYNHGHGPLTFYSPSVLSYARPPITDSPPSVCPTRSPSTFWPSHNHPTMTSLTLHCPQPLVYNEPGPHVPWLESKAHSIGASR